MSEVHLTRRAFLGAMAAVPLFGQSNDWIELFNGRSLDGWRPQRGPGSWKVVDGLLSAEGPMCHLFYDGPVRGADFKNFELEVEVMTSRGCNSGVYFHTVFQETNWPQKGFEVQINNTQSGERKKTASLYNVRNIYRQYVKDDEWFKMNILVRGKSVQVRLNGMMTVDYIQPDPAFVPPGGMERQRLLDHGTVALQCHDPNSRARFRSVRVRPLADDLATPGEAPPADDTFKRIIELGSRGYPMLDLHVHPKAGLSVEQAVVKSRRDGIQYGLAVNGGLGQGVTDDAGAIKWLAGLEGQPVFSAFQAEGREWVQMFSKDSVSRYDYIFSDSMTWTDNHGRRMRTWMPNEVGTIADPQEFMDTLVDRAVGLLEREPIDIYVNPTFLPEVIAKDYETLWTDERRQKVIQAAVKNGVAIEINNRYKLPSPSLIKMAKAAGAKFTFGTNNAAANDLGRCEYAIQMIDDCGLVANDFWIPLAPGSTKAVDRKGEILKKT